MGRRKVIVCNFCRRRKIKCDKGQPCSSCVKYKQTCFYEEINSPPPDSDKETSVLKLWGSDIHLPDLHDDIDLPPGKEGEIYTDTGTLAETEIISGSLVEARRLVKEPEIIPTSNETPIEMTDGGNSLEDRHSFEPKSFSDPRPSIDGAETSISFDNGQLSEETKLSVNKMKLVLQNLATKVDSLERAIKISPESRNRFGIEEASKVNFFKFRQRFHTNHPPTTRNHGILSWVSIIKYDIILSKLWQDRKETPKESRFIYSSSILPFLRDMIPQSSLLDTVRNLERLKAFKNEYLNNPIFENHGSLNGVSAQYELVTIIQRFLPPFDVIHNLLDNYFANVYSHLPYLNERDFRSNIEALIKFDSSINFRSKMDFTYLGILLIILRISYLFVNYRDMQSPMFERLSQLQEPIDARFVLLSQTCLQQFNLLGLLTKPILQLVLFTKAYQQFGPEFGEGPDENEGEMFNTVLIQSCHNLAYDKDPQTNNEIHNNLIRFLWHSSSLLDYTTCITNGSPSNVIKYVPSTQLPNGEEAFSNSNFPAANFDASVLVADSSRSALRLLGIIYPILMLDEKFDISEICNKLLSEYTRLVKEIAVAPNTYVPCFCTQRLQTITMATNLVVSFFYQVYNYLLSVNEPEDALQILLKIYKIIFIVFLPFLDTAKIPGIRKFMVLQELTNLSQKILLINMSTLARLEIFKYMVHEEGQTIGNWYQISQTIQTLISHLTESMSIFRNFLKGLSPYSYSSWKASKVQDFFTTDLNLKKFKLLNTHLIFTHSALTELVTMVSSSLEASEVSDWPSYQVQDNYPGHSNNFSEKYWLLMTRFRNNKDYSMEEYYENLADI